MNPVSSPVNRHCLPATAALIAALVLAACGGGGGSDAPVAVTPDTLTLSGTAASGAAIVGPVVDAKCAAGSASGTTLADGAYSLSIAGGTWPCVVRVAAPGGVALHSVATGSGLVASANITPVTQLVFASLFSADPATYYASFSSAVAAAISGSAVASAQASVVAFLKAAGVDLSSVGDLISGPLKPKTSAAAGDAYDVALDTLASALASSGSTLGTLTAAVINANPGQDNPVASLPAELLLRRATSTCAAMRSGTYRIVTPTSGTTIDAQHGLATFDASTLRITRSDGSISTWTPNGACRFSDQGAGYSADVVVSQAGVLVGRYTRDNGVTFRNFVGFPEQTHNLAELAGDWNTLGMSRVATGYVGSAGSATLNTAGVLTAGASCQNNSTWAIDVCVPLGSVILNLVPALTVNGAGGFDSIDPTTQAILGRSFAYRAGSGALMLLAVGRDGGFSFWTPQRSLALPTVGTVTTSWNFDMLASLASASSTYERSNTINSVDAATGSYVRTQKTPGTNNDHLETLFVNNPRAGFLYRAAGSATAIDGSLQNINEYTLLRTQGMGFSPLLLRSLKLFEFSVAQP
jgi:hypothetical protein